MRRAGASTSGKSPDFDSGYRRFESFRPNHCHCIGGTPGIGGLFWTVPAEARLEADSGVRIPWVPPGRSGMSGATPSRGSASIVQPAQGEEARGLVLEKCGDDRRLLSKDDLDVASGTVPEPQPDDLGRVAEHETALVEVSVFRHDREPFSFRELPYTELSSARSSAKSCTWATSGYTEANACLSRCERF